MNPSKAGRPEQMTMFQVEPAPRAEQDVSLLDGLEAGVVAQLRRLKKAFPAGEQRVTANALQIGRKLLEAEHALSPQTFTDLVRLELQMQPPVARLYMATALLASDYPIFSRLPLPTLRLLARAPEAVRAAAVQRLKAREKLAADDVLRMIKAARLTPRRKEMNDVEPQTGFRFATPKPDHSEVVGRGELMIGAFRGTPPGIDHLWWMVCVFRPDAEGQVPDSASVITSDFCFPTLEEATRFAGQWAHDLKTMPVDEFADCLRPLGP